MPRYIIGFEDDSSDITYYFEWSTVVDAPVSDAMSLEKFRQYYHQQHGDSGFETLEKKLSRVGETGSSCYGEFDNETLYGNRMGEWDEYKNAVKDYAPKVCVDEDGDEWIDYSFSLKQIQEWCRASYEREVEE